MDRPWIQRLLNGLLDEQTITLCTEKFDEYKDVPLSQLGLESMAVMALVVRISTEFGREIDYEAFSLTDVSTLARARDYLGVE